MADLPAIGLRVPQYGSSWDAIRDAALRTEALGFDSVWVNDHLQSPGRVKRDPTFDAFTTLAALAPLTERVRLGTVVASASYRPPPVAAKMATVIDVISGGRLILGLGSGSDVPEHRAYGIPFPPPAERTERLSEALATIRDMFRGEADAPPNVPPSPQEGGPPIWVAAHGPRLLRMAGERADGIVAAFVAPEESGRRLRVAREARPDGLPPLACCLYTFVLPVPSRAEAEDWVRDEAAALDSTPEAYLRWLAGTGIVAAPDDLRATLAAHAEAGVTHAALVLPSRVPAEAMDALAEAVLAPRGVSQAAHNLVTLLVGRWVADGHGDREAVVDERGRWTFAELEDAARRAAGGLRDAGVAPGDRVLVALRDGRPWVQAFLGAAALGAVAVPADPTERERLALLAEDCEPAVVVSAEEEPPPGRTVRPEELDAGAPADVADVGRDDLAYLIYSSGSTGRPKGVMHGHGDMETGIATYAAEVLGLGPEDRCHSMARLFTSLGFGNGFFRVIGSGATAVLTAPRPSPRGVLETVAREGVTVLSAVPTFWHQLARFLERHPDPDALAAVRLAVSSGDSLPGAVAERLRKVTGVELIEGLGCSECSNIVISTRPGEPFRPGVLGRPVAGVEVKLADEEGAPVGRGEPGRLWIRSPSNTSGYWRREEETRELVRGDWIVMGDTLMEDEDGTMRHLGRSDDLFKVDARWVSPSQVESALLEHPAVAEAAVIGVEDDEGLTRPAAFVVLAGGAGDDGLAEELRRHVAHELAPHMAPRTVTVRESLPRLPSGKLDRRRLREG